MDFLDQINLLLDSSASSFLSFIAGFWWIVSFLILFPLATNMWLWWKQILFKNKMEWTLLEIVPPREVRKSPKAMEQILTTLYSLKNAPGDFFEKWIDGEVTKWFSLEITSSGGEIHFFIRTPTNFKNIIEANFYAHYPDSEIFVVDDYVNRLPQTTKGLYESGLEIFGSELLLDKNDAYPIRTYAEFEAIEDEQKIDPISGLLENLGKLKKGENFWLQIIIRPADSKWKEKGVKLIEELRTKQTMKIKTAEGKTVEAPIGLTPGQTNVIKAIENNISKPGFDTVMRVLYIAPKTIYSHTFANKGLAGILNQYSSMNLNSFKHNGEVRTSELKWHKYPFFNLKERLEGRKQRILKRYIERSFPEELAIGRLLSIDPSNFNFFSKSFVLNTEELATIYHLPYYFVLTAPYIRQLPSKKTGPPAGLPIFKE